MMDKSKTKYQKEGKIEPKKKLKKINESININTIEEEELQEYQKNEISKKEKNQRDDKKMIIEDEDEENDVINVEGHATKETLAKESKDKIADIVYQMCLKNVFFLSFFKKNF